MDGYGNEMTELPQILSLSITLLINRNTIALQWQCSVSINAECGRREGYAVIEKLINEEDNNNNFYRAFCDENYSMLFNGDLKILNLQRNVFFKESPNKTLPWYPED